MKISKRKFRLAIISIVVIAFFIPIVRGCIIPLGKYIYEDISLEEQREKRKREFKEYFALFSSDARTKIKAAENDDLHTKKSQHTIFKFYYVPYYYMLVYKVDILKDVALYEFIKIEKNKNNSAYGLITTREDVCVDLHFSSENDSIAENIFMRYDDTILDKTTCGDSMINFNLKTKDLSFRYEKDDDVKDVVFNSKKFMFTERDRPILNMNVLFYKKNMSVYIIVLYPTKQKQELGSFQLLNLLESNIAGYKEEEIIKDTIH